MEKSRYLTKDLEIFLTGNSTIKNRIVDYIKAHLDKGVKSVALCFRGDYFCLYYRCQKLLEVGKDLVGKFDFRHARFSENYKEYERSLTALGVYGFFEKKYERNGYYVSFDLNGKGCVDAENVWKILDIYKSLIDDYISPDKKKYAFDVPESSLKNGGIKINKSKNKEKDRQQEIYARYFFKTNERLIYDLEYVEHQGKKYGVQGRFDLLGLQRRENGWTLQLIEVKSTKEACKQQKSGVAAHIEDYTKYLKNSALMTTRKTEAVQTVALLARVLGFEDFLQPIEIVGEEIIFFFTDKAIECGQEQTLCMSKGIRVERY